MSGRSRQKYGHLWAQVQVDQQDRHLLDSMAWSIQRDHGTYYIQGTDRVDGKRKHRLLHRMILGCAPGEQVDHVNGDGLDNRRVNLRICTVAENNRNRRPRGGTSSRFKGVYLDRQRRKWQAQIYIAGRRKHLGYFDDELDAARAYDAAAHRLFGDFARPNVIVR